MTELKSKPLVWQIRVYFEDTDAGGVVYHARYLNFFERARTELLRDCGIQSETLRQDHKLIWVVLDIHVHYKQAARLDDELMVSAEMTWKKGVRQGFEQTITRKSDGALIATAELTAAMLHADSLKPARMPAWMEAEFSNDK